MVAVARGLRGIRRAFRRRDVVPVLVRTNYTGQVAEGVDQRPLGGPVRPNWTLLVSCLSHPNGIWLVETCQQIGLTILFRLSSVWQSLFLSSPREHFPSCAHSLSPYCGRPLPHP